MFGKLTYHLAVASGWVFLTIDRILLHPFFAAVRVILQNVLRCPASPQAHTDLQIVEPFLRLLEVLAGEGIRGTRSEEAKRMHQVCNDLNAKAKVAVERVSLEVLFLP